HLSNGLTVRYCEDTTRQLLHVGMTLRGGASIDRPQSMGLAHLDEHLFFQYLPDSSPATAGIDRGIFLAHNTQLEGHFFGISITPEACGVALEMIGNGLKREFWTDSMLMNAKAQIAAELQQIENTPENNLRSELQDQLWHQNAVQKHVFGSYPDILRMGTTAIQSATEKFRNPLACLLTGTGRMAASAFFDLAEAGLGNWQKDAGVVELAHIELPKLDKSLYFTSVNEFAVQPVLMMAWPVPAGANPWETSRDARIFCRLAGLRQGLLYQSLVGRGLAHNLEWSWAGGVLPGQLLLYVIPVQDSLPQCLAAIQSCLQEMGTGPGIRKEDIVAVNWVIRLQNALTKDQSMGRLMVAGQNWLLSLDSGLVSPTLTADRMRTFCNAYLSKRAHVAGLLLNSESMVTLDAGQVFKEPKTVAAVVAVVPKDTVSAMPAPKSSDPATLRSLRVVFAQEEFGIESSLLPLLDDLAAMLLANPEKRVFLNSFSEGIGDGVRNYQLSVSRAKAVRQWLASQRGVPPAQIVIRAYGEAFPEFPDENDLRNRRLTFDFAPQDAQDNVF
ncbi:MAG: hypothetical protein RLZZ519_2152, partial [Bacteroidota bacterium]